MNGIRIVHQPALPPATMIVSTDIWQQMQDKATFDEMGIAPYDPGIEKIKLQTESIKLLK
jgi:hypothetical protein